MSKFYKKYLELKKNNSEVLYLFHCGKFYIFLDEDALLINKYVVLKRTKFTNEIDKCGFPENVLNEYLEVFKNHGLKIEVVENINEDVDYLNIIKKIKRLDLDKTTPIDALNKLYEIKREINE